MTRCAWVSSMTVHLDKRMTADEFLEWSMRRAGRERYELVSGEIVAMSPERAGHIRAKHLVWLALRDALRAVSFAGEVLGDGMSVRIDEMTVYEPDTLVRAGQPVEDATIEVADPMIVVEVVSPSSHALDTGSKLADYFRLPSVRHYLIVNTKDRTVIHHSRGAGEQIDTRIVRSGAVRLNPPGIAVDVEGFFET